MKRILGAALILVLSMLVAPVAAGGGFDEFGYNYQARIFVARLTGWTGFSMEPCGVTPPMQTTTW